MVETSAPSAGTDKMGTVIDITTGETREVARRQLRLARLNRRRVAFFRNAAATYGEGPTSWTSDDEIIRVHQRVTEAFYAACQYETRTPPNRWKLNFIVLKFLEVKEVIDEVAVEALLECEVEWYLQNGLRTAYDYELRP